MSYGRKCQCPLEEPPVSRPQAWGNSSGGSGARAATKLRADESEQRLSTGSESRRRSRSPRKHPGYSSALAVGPSARFQAQGARSGSTSDADRPQRRQPRDINGGLGFADPRSLNANRVRSPEGSPRLHSSIKRSRSPAAYATSATAFKLLRKCSAFRYPLQKATNRGSNAPLDEAEREAAMAEVTQDVYASSTVGRWRAS